MKEKLYTIELTDGVRSGDECMFCWLERKIEQENLEFVLGSSYMESDIREKTDQAGFCKHHTKMMYDYGNSLGNAWILKSRLEYLNQQLKKQIKNYNPEGSSGLFGRLKKNSVNDIGIGAWVSKEEGHCYICTRMNHIYKRMLDTFIYQLKHDPGFGENLMASNGFCIHHFGDVWQLCETDLSKEEKELWMPKLSLLMIKNLDRIQEDIDWLIEKYDYRNRDADWKSSKDAIQRTMEKITGGHPGDPVFQCRK